MVLTTEITEKSREEQRREEHRLRTISRLAKQFMTCYRCNTECRYKTIAA